MFGQSTDSIRNGFDLDLDPLDATFRDSSAAPLHSWFPYLEGYSPRFVERIRHEYLGEAKRIIEPFGGTGTTANTFIFLLWATLQHRDVVGKLKSELKSAFPSAISVPDYQVRCMEMIQLIGHQVVTMLQTCSRLPYLQAVINETLRMYPTIVAMLPRTATHDSTVAGVPVPKE